MVYCSCCQSNKHSAYCQRCIQEGVTSQLHFTDNLRSQCASAIDRSIQLIGKSNRGLEAWRKLRAEVAEREIRCEHLRKDVEAKMSEFRKRRRGTGRIKQDHVLNKPYVNLDTVRSQEHALMLRILHARRVLVMEAIYIFGLEQLMDGTWTIAGAPLLNAIGLRGANPTYVNAALSHTVHLLSLIIRYLSITLPFEPSWTRQPHVGRMIIRANAPFLNSTKYRDKYPLWMSATSVRSSHRDARAAQKYRQFLIAYALLCHSVGYLAWTQGVDGIGLEPDAEISPIPLLSVLPESQNLGKRAHEPGTLWLNHLGFSLDVNHVVEHMLGPEDDQGWDIVEDALPLP